MEGGRNLAFEPSPRALWLALLRSTWEMEVRGSGPCGPTQLQDHLGGCPSPPPRLTPHLPHFPFSLLVSHRIYGCGNK